MEGLIDYVKGYRDIKEIPRGQRYAGRPGLEVLFDEGIKGDREKRKEKVQEAVERHGYRQKEVADYIYPDTGGYLKGDPEMQEARLDTIFET